jgi:hypothetical protein
MKLCTYYQKKIMRYLDSYVTFLFHQSGLRLQTYFISIVVHNI